MTTTQRVSYEWDCERIDIEENDVIEHDFGDPVYVLRNARETPNPGERFDVVLVRNVHTYIDNVCDDLVDRQWATVENGRLPSHFSDGVEVPERFHKQLAKAYRMEIANYFCDLYKYYSIDPPIDRQLPEYRVSRSDIQSRYPELNLTDYESIQPYINKEMKRRGLGFTK